MLQRLRSRLHGEEGFTLVELLVVILIIGILAAIAIPTFLNQKGKATDSSAISTAQTAQTAMETYYTDHNSYTGADVDALGNIEKTLGSAATPSHGLAVSFPTGSSYEVTTTGGDSRTYSILVATDGSVTHPCSVPSGAPTTGDCVLPSGQTSGNGTWAGLSSGQ